MKKYITEEEIIKILGYKNSKSYKNSSGINKKINTLIELVLTRIELEHKTRLEAIKKELITSIKEIK
jgi:hypothetical protein